MVMTAPRRAELRWWIFHRVAVEVLVAFDSQTKRTLRGLQFGQEEISQFLFMSVHEPEEPPILAIGFGFKHVPRPARIRSEEFYNYGGEVLFFRGIHRSLQ